MTVPHEPPAGLSDYVNTSIAHHLGDRSQSGSELAWLISRQLQPAITNLISEYVQTHLANGSIGLDQDMRFQPK